MAKKPQVPKPHVILLAGVIQSPSFTVKAHVILLALSQWRRERSDATPDHHEGSKNHTSS
jgi:hypothetical protein